MAVSNHGQHKISVSIRQHKESIFDSQKSTDPFLIMSKLVVMWLPVSESSWRDK